MSELVLLHHNQPMTTSLAIAEGVEMAHASVIKLVRKYVDDLQKFGPFGFEIQKGASLPQGGNAKSTEIAYLNEGQSIFLLTLMRNSEIVVRFKVALVQAFLELRDRLAVPPAPTFQTHQLDHGADLAVAADRTFRSFLRASRSAGLRLPAALRVANQQTLARTGMDMLAAIGVDPDATPEPAPVAPAAPDPVADAVAAWAAGAGPGRYLMEDIIEAALGVPRASRDWASLSVYAGRALRAAGFTHRKRWLNGSLRNVWERAGT